MPQKKKVTDDQIIEAVERTGSFRRAAGELGVDTNVTNGRYKRLTGRQTPPVVEKTKTSFRKTEHDKDGTAEIESIDYEIQTVADALKRGGVDVAIWEVERHVLNSWQVGMKFGRAGSEQAIKRTLWQVKVWLRRRVPKAMEESCALILARVKAVSPRFVYEKPLPKLKDGYLLEFSPFDLHFGKLAWKPESGDDYDVKIARRLLEQAFEDVMARCAGFPIEKIVIPIGQDFFTVDNMHNLTVNDTPQDVDGRFPKVYHLGVEACMNVVVRAASFAPVEVKWVPGNHDRTTSYFLCRELAALLIGNKRVTVDVSPRYRKYLLYGVSLLGWTHGDEEKHSDLPNIMATEVPALWSTARHREWHIGHTHKQKETKHVAGDTHGSVVVRTLPSLCGTDAWHYLKGYVGHPKAAEAYLWGKTEGYVGHFSVSARKR